MVRRSLRDDIDLYGEIDETIRQLKAKREELRTKLLTRTKDGTSRMGDAFVVTRIDSERMIFDEAKLLARFGSAIRKCKSPVYVSTLTCRRRGAR